MTNRKHIPLKETFKRYWYHYRYKDRLFRRVFRDKKDLLQLYNAINDTSYENPDDLVITTLEDTIILSMKNDLSFIISSDMNLYEHQSTFNPNMPIRGVIYFSRLYEIYIAQHGLDLYGSKLIKLPMPQYVIFYNGETDKPDRMVLKLSDAFEMPEAGSSRIPALECTAIMLNINLGHNDELLSKCKRLKDYSIFIAKIRKYTKSGYSLKTAIDKAMDECIEEGVLMDILFKQRLLAKSKLLTEYDEKKRRKLDRQEGFEDGREQTLTLIVRKKMSINMPLDMISEDIGIDIEILRPIYESVKKELNRQSDT